MRLHAQINGSNATLGHGLFNIKDGLFRDKDGVWYGDGEIKWAEGLDELILFSENSQGQMVCLTVCL
jgi:hypothetical protein